MFTHDEMTSLNASHPEGESKDRGAFIGFELDPIGKLSNQRSER